MLLVGECVYVGSQAGRGGGIHAGDMMVHTNLIQGQWIDSSRGFAGWGIQACSVHVCQSYGPAASRGGQDPEGQVRGGR
jgi:hypothetical protein